MLFDVPLSFLPSLPPPHHLPVAPRTAQVSFSSVEERLIDVANLHVSAGAFAAVLCDGSVVTWGDRRRPRRPRGRVRGRIGCLNPSGGEKKDQAPGKTWENPET